MKSVVFLFPGVLVSAIVGAVISTAVIEIKDQNNEKQLISPVVGLFNLLNGGTLPEGTTGKIKDEAFSKILPEDFEQLTYENKVQVGQRMPEIIDALSIEALYKYVGDNGLVIARPGKEGDESIGILTIYFQMGASKTQTNINIPFPKSELIDISSASLKHVVVESRTKNQKNTITTNLEIWDEDFNLHNVELKNKQSNLKKIKPEILASVRYLNQIYKKIKQRIESEGDKCHPNGAGFLWELID